MIWKPAPPPTTLLGKIKAAIWRLRRDLRWKLTIMFPRLFPWNLELPKINRTLPMIDAKAFVETQPMSTIVYSPKDNI